MLFLQNPILMREFNRGARSWKILSMVFAALAALSFILYALWPRSGVFSDANSNELFTMLLGVELSFMILLTAGFTASAVTSERERGSFVMLQTSLLSPGDIMTGKLLGTLGMPFVMFIITVPVTGVCALSGGISAATLGKALAIVALSTVIYGIMGLAISSMCRKTYVAILVTYLSMAVLAGATWLPSVLFKSELLRPWFLRLRALSPYEALFALQFSENYESGIVGASAASVFWIFSGSMLFMGVIFFLIFARFIFSPPSFRHSMTVSKYEDGRTMIKRKLGWPFYLIDPLKRKKPIGDRRNPVFVAELRSKIFGNPRFIARALCVCICISLGLLVAVLGQVGETDLDKIRAVAIIFQIGLVALLAPTVSSGSITDERVSDTLLQLRLSPVSSFSVVMGKMKAALVYVVIFLLSSLPVLIILTLLENSMTPDFSGIVPETWNWDGIVKSAGAFVKAFGVYWRIIAWSGVLLLTCLLFSSAGLCASSFAPSTGVATAVSYGFALSLSILSLSVLMFGSRAGGEVQAAFLMFNPFAAALDITLDQSFVSKLPHLFGNRLWVNHMYISGMFTIVLLIASAIKVNMIFREQK